MHETCWKIPVSMHRNGKRLTPLLDHDVMGTLDTVQRPAMLLKQFDQLFTAHTR